MKTISVKPFENQSVNVSSTDSKKVAPTRNIKQNIKNIASKIRHGKVNGKVAKVDTFQAAVIDDLYKNPDLFSDGEAKIDLNTKDGEIPLQETDEQDVKALWHNFMQDTSMHGLKHVNQQQQYKLRRIIWFLAVIGMGSFMTYNLYTLFNAYSKYPTMSNVNFEMVEELQFPAVTICNVSPYRKSALNGDPKLDYYFLSISRMSPFVPSLDYSDPANSDYHKPLNDTWLQNMSHSVDDIFEYCIESNTIVSCKTKLTPHITEAGLCYTYNSYEYAKTYGAMKTSLTGSNSAPTFYVHVNQDQYVYNRDMAAGIKIIIHDPSEEPDVVNKAIVASPGFATYVSVKMTKYKYLPTPYKATTNQYCLDTKADNFVNPLKYQPIYSRYGCVRECKRDYVVNQCGCRSFMDHGNETICSLAEYDTCYMEYCAEFERNGSLQTQCHCKLECEFTKYEAAVSTTYFPANVYTNILNSMGLVNHRTDWLEIRIFFDTLSYMNVQQVAEYTPELLVGVIGGQMGIFLGASLLTLSELIEFILLSMFVAFRRFSLRRKSKRI